MPATQTRQRGPQVEFKHVQFGRNLRWVGVVCVARHRIWWRRQTTSFPSQAWQFALVRGADAQVVEVNIRLPIVEGEELVTRTGERRRIGPREERRAIQPPVNHLALTGDGEMVAAAQLDGRGLPGIPRSLRP